MKSRLIQKIIDENRLTNRIKENSSPCPCYQGDRCHNHLSDYEMICLFCVCPEYKKEEISGGCNLNESKNLTSSGKWFYHQNLLTGKIWDCSDCTLPHTEGFVRKYLNALSMPQLKKIKSCKDISSLWDFFKDVSWG
jgi:Zn-finger protein